MYTRARRAAADVAPPSLGREPVGPAGSDRGLAGAADRTGGDRWKCRRSGGGSTHRAAAARRRHRPGARADRRACECRQPVPPLAGAGLRRPRRRAGAGIAASPHRAELGSIGPRGGRPNRGGGEQALRARKTGLSTSASSTWRNCGRWSIAAGCSSVGIPGRCTLRRRRRHPIVGIYGPTESARSAPWRDPRFRTESVELAGLPCRPCDQRICEPGDFRCLTTLRPEDVLSAAERAMNDGA